MSEILKQLKKEKRSLYSFLQSLGVDPHVSQTSFQLKLAGLRPITQEEYQRIKKAIGHDVAHRIETTSKIFLQ
jgi:hypothetical protein